MKTLVASAAGIYILNNLSTQDLLLKIIIGALILVAGLQDIKELLQENSNDSGWR